MVCRLPTYVRCLHKIKQKKASYFLLDLYYQQIHCIKYAINENGCHKCKILICFCHVESYRRADWICITDGTENKVIMFCAKWNQQSHFNFFQVTLYVKSFADEMIYHANYCIIKAILL